MTRPSDPAELAAYYDVQYNARASVEDFDQYPRQYRVLSDDAHAALRCFKDVPYGPGAAERLGLSPANPVGWPPPNPKLPAAGRSARPVPSQQAGGGDHGACPSGGAHLPIA